MNWPCRSAPWTPSPYEIFDLDRKANYTKHKYYELVKIYHPDRSGSCGDLTHVERLERYRLVVQAHEILSDPIKRRAFDSTGAGWGERNATRYTRGYSSADGKTYGHGPEHDSTIFNNATWEDWERWYRRNDNPSKQAYGGTYVHPNAFASFVIILAVISGILQATRAGQYSGKLEEKARAFTEETSRFMADRADHFQEHQVTREGRIKHFLEKRDPSKYGLKDEEEEAYRNHFGDTLSATPRLDDSSS
jgi:curved DNA-binding protein CbpA